MDAYINFILENFRYDSYPLADRALKMHYETTFNIFDHRASTLKGQRPFSSQAYHAGHDKGPLYYIEYLIDTYNENQVYDFTKMDWATYCQLTPDAMSRLHTKLSERRRRKSEEEEQRAREEERRMQLLLNGGAKQQSPGVNARAMFSGQH